MLSLGQGGGRAAGSDNHANTRGRGVSSSRRGDSHEEGCGAASAAPQSPWGAGQSDRHGRDHRAAARPAPQPLRQQPWKARLNEETLKYPFFLVAQKRKAAEKQ